MMPRHSSRDAGFTLPEYLIAIVLSATISAVIGFAIIVSLRTLPGTTDTADSGVAVQGITTWLPPDVDSTEPGAFDTDPSTPSGCSGADPGVNLLRMSWTETFNGTTRDYVANYRFTTSGNVGKIERVSCSGVSTLGSPSLLGMSAKLSSTVPTVTTFDTDGDTLDDQVKFSIETLAGDTVYIDAASKNPHETLPPASTSPTTTTTAAPNNPPVASPMSFTANPSAPVTFTLAATDPDGDALTATLDNLPGGWVASVVGLDVTLTPTGPPAFYTFDFEVEDPSGADASSTVTVEVIATTTTTSTTTTTTTTLPPCTVSNISVSPSTVALKFNDPSKLKKDVDVEITLGGGYCIGLTLQYDTGAPNGQYVQNFGSSAPYIVTLKGHPQGTELWAAGTHTLEVRDGADNLLTTATLTVVP